MTDQQRDPEADGPEDAADPEATPEDADLAAAEDEELEAEDEELDGADDITDGLDEDEAGGAAPLDSATAAGAAAGTSAGATSRRRGIRGTPPAKGAAPTLADEAVRVEDRASSWFVIATVGVFVLVFAWALLLGRNGPISDLFKTPRPEATAAPSLVVSPSAEPSLVVSPSIEPSVAPSEPASPVPTGS